MRRVLLKGSSLIYERIARPLIFRRSAQAAHGDMLRLLARLDKSDLACGVLGWISKTPHPSPARGSFAAYSRPLADPLAPVYGEGEKDLWGRCPLILAAGLVKGAGFESEEAALAAVEAGRNIMPGWRCVPRLVGLVEFGSFTRHPRPGNPGVVLWRDAATQSTQNRVGLKNPGARAAAAFLARNQARLPRQFGINIAVSPGVTEIEQEQAEAIEALRFFLAVGIRPAWFTLNLSCPNTEDDPSGNQTEDKTRRLCGALVAELREYNIPLWAKVSPGLSAAQYAALMRAFEEVGVRGVVATNTLAAPSPDDASVMAGVGGGRLRERAFEALCWLAQEKARGGYGVDIIACGGVMTGADYRRCLELGVSAVQYWSALVYRGPLAAAIIESEGQHDKSKG